jgi:nucleoside-diphosphate-sugar epimerase
MEIVVTSEAPPPESLWLPNFLPSSEERFAGIVGQRVMVVGATGWMGKAVQYLLRQIDCEVLLLGSPRSREVRPWDIAIARAFKADGLVFLAGVTPDIGQTIGRDAYVTRLSEVSTVLEQSLDIPSLRWISYASSGIVEAPPREGGSEARDAYRAAKAREEALVGGAAGARLIAQIYRIYSLSGPFVTRPRNYALFDLIRQAKSGVIHVSARSAVWRNYTSVIDLAAVMLSSSTRHRSEILPTGGTPIELRDLASVIAHAVNPSATIRSLPEVGTPDLYYAVGKDWDQRCSELHLASQTLESQIRASALWLRHRS